MKTLPAGLDNALLSGVTTLCNCWRLERPDGIVLGFTDHDRDLSFDAVDYKAETGLTASQWSSSADLSIDTIDAHGALTSGSLTEEDLAGGLWDGAEVVVYLVDWSDVSLRIVTFKGTIGEVSRGPVAFMAELRGLTHALDQAQGRTYQHICDAVLGDGRCGIDLDLAAFKGSGSVTASTDDRILTVSGLGVFDDGWFRYGLLAFTSGANNGVSIEVRAHVKTAGSVAIELWRRAPFAIEDGDAFTVTAGCDKTFATCKAKFSNQINFRGFPHMPGNDRAFSYVVGQSGENDGGSFFNDSSSGGGFGS